MRPPGTWAIATSQHRLRRFAQWGAAHEVLVAGEENAVEHALVEKEVSHPLGDDDVDVLDGENDLLHLALDERDGCSKRSSQRPC